MIWFSHRLRLEKLFEKWCLENNAKNCPQNVVAFLQIHHLIDEEKCLKFLKSDPVDLNDENVKKSSDILLALELAELNVSAIRTGEIHVCYRGADVKDGMFLVSAYGRGKDFEEACADYLSQIRGKTLVFDACTKHRREVTFLG